MKLKGSQAIVKLLQEQGVDTIFGYPGGQVIPLYDALYDSPLRNVLTAHEQGAVHAADGYARSSGKTGVVIVTSGPGATNIVTGLATAYLDSVPLVALTGQVGVGMLGRDSFQEIDIVGVTLPVTKYNVMVRSGAGLLPSLRRAFAIARQGRPGPVLVDIPSNIQNEEIEWTEPEVEYLADIPKALPEFIKEAAATLNAAQRPVLLVGGGAVNSDAQAELLQLARRSDLAVVNSLMGVGVFPESDPRCLGLTGMHGHIASNLAVANADVLIVAGSRFSDRVTGDRNRYVGQKTIIQIDIDPTEIDKNVAVAVPLMGDIKETVAALLPLIEEKKHPAWWEQIKKWDATEDRSLLADGRLTAPWLMRELTTTLAAEEPIYVTDVGQNQMWAAQHLVIDAPRHHLTSGGCGTMGFGLPGALGAAFAKPKARIVVISGDGGFKMTGMELYTAVREKRKLICVVVNNSCLGMVRQWQQLFYNARYSNTLLTEFDFAAFASSCGAAGKRVTDRAGFTAALAEARASEVPFVIDACIAQDDLVEPMVAPGAVLNDFVNKNIR